MASLVTIVTTISADAAPPPNVIPTLIVSQYNLYNDHLVYLVKFYSAGYECSSSQKLRATAPRSAG